jgi:hypothetical protein
LLVLLNDTRALDHRGYATRKLGQQRLSEVRRTRSQLPQVSDQAFRRIPSMRSSRPRRKVWLEARGVIGVYYRRKFPRAQAAQGLLLTEAFYWDMNDETRAWLR